MIVFKQMKSASLFRQSLQVAVALAVSASAFAAEIKRWGKVIADTGVKPE